MHLPTKLYGFSIKCIIVGIKLINFKKSKIRDTNEKFFTLYSVVVATSELLYRKNEKRIKREKTEREQVSSKTGENEMRK